MPFLDPNMATSHQQSNASQPSKIPDLALKLLVPENLLYNYTDARLQQGLAYADARLKRHTVPKTHNWLRKYQILCRKAIEQMTSSDKERLYELQKEVQRHEIMMSRYWMTYITDRFEMATAMNLIALRQFAYYQRYGMYLIGLARKLGDQAIEKQIRDWNYGRLRSGGSDEKMWKNTSVNLRAEQETWNREGTLDISRVPTCHAIYNACKYVQIDFIHMVNVIHLYVERNQTFNNGLIEDIKTTNCGSKVARGLHQDTMELSCLVPFQENDDDKILKVCLEVIRDEWFETLCKPEKPDAWTWKFALVEYSKALNSDHTDEFTNKHVAAIVEKAAALLGKDTKNVDRVMEEVGTQLVDDLEDVEMDDIEMVVNGMEDWDMVSELEVMALD